MRMRKKKHGAERLAAQSVYLVEKPDAPISSPTSIFGREGELHLEIGCGKGGFACGMAAKYPDINFCAFERVSDVMVVAVEQAAKRAEERTADNLRFMIGDAATLTEWFAPGSLDTIYLNFSDPWPKAKHAKRRLTERRLLTVYFDLLRDGGTLRFKTDNVPLFDFTLEELDALGVCPDYVTRDLHASELDAENVRTEYEQSFASQGIPINLLSVKVHKTK